MRIGKERETAEHLGLSAPVEIGGFFALDLAERAALHQTAFAFNTARSALRWLLAHIISVGRRVERIWLPAFNCPVVEEMLKAEFPHLELPRYSVSDELEPEFSVSPSETDLYYAYNVFGLKDAFISSLPRETIVDNVHAFFTPSKPGHQTLYSARKFFGVPDGAYLYTELDLAIPPPSYGAWDRGAYLLKRHDVGSGEAYRDFVASEDLLSKAPVTGMSRLAERLLGAIDYEAAREKRGENFRILHASLGESNLLRGVIDRALEDTEFVPFSYPWFHPDGSRLRGWLVERGIFVPTLWAEVAESAEASPFEKRLARDVVHIPVDQRYGQREMEYVLKAVRGW